MSTQTKAAGKVERTTEPDRTIALVQEDGDAKPKDRFEEYDLIGPEGHRVHVKRNIDTGEQVITGEAMQRGDRPGVDDELSIRVVRGEVGKDMFPPPSPEPEPPVGATPVVDGDPARQVLPVTHEDVATPDEVKRRSRQTAAAAKK